MTPLEQALELLAMQTLPLDTEQRLLELEAKAPHDEKPLFARMVWESFELKQYEQQRPEVRGDWRD